MARLTSNTHRKLRRALRIIAKKVAKQRRNSY